jgi:hypothetical protein
MQLTNLPFTSVNVTDAYGSVFTFLQNITIPALSLVQSVVVPNAARIDMYSYPLGGGATASLALDTDGEVIYTATYEAA